jgi:hypothetical protein
MLSALFFTPSKKTKPMQITVDQLIAGYPAITVRNFLRKYVIAGLVPECAQSSLLLSPQEASAFLNKLVDLGLLRESGNWNGSPFFDLTDSGVRLVHASAAKPIHRKVAERVLAEFLERMECVNATPEYLYRVDTAILYGSMLSNTERLGNVNVAINMESKASGKAEFEEWGNERRYAAQRNGRTFCTIVERAYNI